MQQRSLLWDARTVELELTCLTQLSANTETQTAVVTMVQESTDEMEQTRGIETGWKQAFP